MMKNRDFQIAYEHLQKSIEESEEAVKKAIELIHENIELVNENGIDRETFVENLTKQLELLQFQDILAQRLKKVQQFLIQTDNSISTHQSEIALKEFAWEKEIEQENVDDILKSYGL